MFRSEAVPCLVGFMGCLPSDSMLKTFNNRLLVKLRHPDPQVALRVLGLMEEAVLRIGDRYSFLTADVLPFLAETVNTCDPAIERLSKSILEKLSLLSKEDLAALLRVKPR
jgi:hypothetical protein